MDTTQPNSKLDTCPACPSDRRERSRREILTSDRLTSLLFYLSILFFIIGFQFSDTMLNGWYQQFMPNLNGAQIRDITFIDSLTGYAVTSLRSSNDSAIILKTTNSGDNWNIKFMHDKAFVRVQFINANTGFTNAYTKIFKTTNAGENWNPINLPSIFGDDMFVLSEDTIWLAMSESLTGGVFRTTNGGASWDRQLNLGSQNPDHIYMINGRIGFICKNNFYLRRTTNSGLNWDTISGANGFRDMFFIDSSKGWKAYDSVKMTTNGGINWQTQILPFGLGISSLFATTFSNINIDTIWLGGGRMIFPNSQGRGMVFRTTNQGNNWLFQIPDTAIVAGIYSQVKFINKYSGWANTGFVQIHTTTGGNDTFLTSVNQISSNVSYEYKLKQNYPNPFNPITKISYELRVSNYVKILAFDITGKEIEILVDQKQNTGKYEVTFDGTNYSSGVYFYSLYINGKLVDTKRMILLK